MKENYIPVCRPLLPPADLIADYIRRIDGRRQYTNRGPLVQLLEQRLAARLGHPEHTVRTSASGTSALEVAILAAAGQPDPARPLALVPSFTFAATGLAVERCGYQPYFVDIDPHTWAVDAEALAHHPQLDRVGLIVPVAAYGVMPDMRALEALHAKTGLPVVVDAAAAFEQILDRPDLISETVVLTVSFHATKTFSTGEGGAILWRNADGQDRAVQLANFGFRLGRQSLVGGLNAKMSEYHAAVGLAMLDGFDATRRSYAVASGHYRDTARGTALSGKLHLPPQISSAYAMFETDDQGTFLRAEDRLLAAGVETRRWYEAGLHVQPHFAGCAHDPVPVTDDLCKRLIGLPMAPDLSAADVASVMQALHHVTTCTAVA